MTPIHMPCAGAVYTLCEDCANEVVQSVGCAYPIDCEPALECVGCWLKQSDTHILDHAILDHCRHSTS